MRLSECVRGALDGQSVGSVPVGVFLRRNKNRHGSRVGRIRTHLNVSAVFVSFFFDDRLYGSACVCLCVWAAVYQ